MKILPESFDYRTANWILGKDDFWPSDHQEVQANDLEVSNPYRYIKTLGLFQQLQNKKTDSHYFFSGHFHLLTDNNSGHRNVDERANKRMSAACKIYYL